MTEHIWSVLCQNALINQATNNVSLIEVVERISFQANPDVNLEQIKDTAIPVQLNLVTQWARSQFEKPETVRGRIILKAPNGKSIKSAHAEYPIDLENNTSFRTIVNFPGFPFVGSGLYQIVVQVKAEERWKSVASIPLQVVKEPTKVSVENVE